MIIHIVDDDESIRKFLEIIIRSEGFQVKTYSGADEFLACYDAAQPGCLLLDVRMPGIDGLQLQEMLKTRNIVIPLIMMTGHADVKMAVQAMKNGALNFIEKPIDKDMLLKTLHACHNTSKNIHQKLVQRDEFEKRFQTLTKREQEIFMCIAEGKLNKTIAGELGISIRTVEAHRYRIMTKLNANSLSDIVRMRLSLKNEAYDDNQEVDDNGDSKLS
ncbi:MAG: response regulator [Pseudomonadota bacterium]|nr:response regulator [Pseudomonadota bacterium]